LFLVVKLANDNKKNKAQEKEKQSEIENSADNDASSQSTCCSKEAREKDFEDIKEPEPARTINNV
jgi:hypothetical protein